jgi:hypothetical protein
VTLSERSERTSAGDGIGWGADFRSKAMGLEGGRDGSSKKWASRYHSRQLKFSSRLPFSRFSAHFVKTRGKVSSDLRGRVVFHTCPHAREIIGIYRRQTIQPGGRQGEKWGRKRSRRHVWSGAVDKMLLLFCGGGRRLRESSFYPVNKGAKGGALGGREEVARQRGLWAVAGRRRLRQDRTGQGAGLGVPFY